MPPPSRQDQHSGPARCPAASLGADVRGWRGLTTRVFPSHTFPSSHVRSSLNLSCIHSESEHARAHLGGPGNQAAEHLLFEGASCPPNVTLPKADRAEGHKLGPQMVPSGLEVTGDSGAAGFCRCHGSLAHLPGFQCSLIYLFIHSFNT